MTTCRREPELLAALQRGLRLDEEHVAACAACAETFAVAHAIGDDVFVPNDVSVLTAGGAWWRIERRAREEATRAAARTVSRVQIATVAIVAVLAVVLLGGISTIQGWFADLAIAVPLAQWGALIVLSIAAFAVLTPFAIYYAVTEE